jgi:hypothetical protein
VKPEPLVNRLSVSESDPRNATAGNWLAPIAELEDSIGVLSIYVDADPALAAGTPPAWQTPIRTELRELLREARREWPRDHRMAFEARLEELEPELAAVLERRDLSRGRALFAAIERGEVRRIDVHAVLPSLVTVATQALVLPLVAARQAGQPAGVAELSWTEVVLSEWEFGVLGELETIALGVDLAGEPGRPMTNPSVPQSFPERDRFDTGVGARVLTRIREVGTVVAREAKARGWDVVVVDGVPRFVEAFEGGIGPDGAAVLPSAEPLADVSRAEAADRVGAVLRDRRKTEEERLVERLDASPAATRDAAVVERALAEGRVEHLLLEMSGVPRSLAAGEALLRQALRTGAEVTVVEAISAPVGPNGVAALLRW